MKRLEDWLDDKVSELIINPEFIEDATEETANADYLRSIAEDEGYNVGELEQLCGGSIEQYLLEKQNAYTAEHMKEQD